MGSRRVVIAKLNVKSMRGKMTAHCVMKVSKKCSTAVSAALATRETMSRNPTPRTSPIDRTRFRTICHQTTAFSCGVFQIRSSVYCSSPKTLVAPTKRVMCKRQRRAHIRVVVLHPAGDRLVSDRANLSQWQSRARRRLPPSLQCG